MTPTTADQTTPRLLHLGCGRITPPEWVNLDGSRNAWLAQHPLLRRMAIMLGILPKTQAKVAWPKNILIADFRKPLPFPSNSFDGAYSCYLLEHIYREDVIRLLQEMLRILKPGGYCRTLVPDFAAFVQEYLGQIQMNPFDPEYEARVGNDRCRRMIARLSFREEYGPRGNIFERLYRAMTDYNSHKWMYDAPSMIALMTEAGFVDCRQREPLDSSIPHIEKVEEPEKAQKGEGIIVEGRRP